MVEIKTKRREKKLKRKMRIFGAITCCLLIVSVALPNICLANPQKFEGKVTGEGGYSFRDIAESTIGDLHKGDRVKIVITDLETNSGLSVGLEFTLAAIVHNPSLMFASSPKAVFYFPGEKEIIIPTNAEYYCLTECTGHENWDYAMYRGYLEVIK